jgi:hypothetical protein
MFDGFRTRGEAAESSIARQREEFSAQYTEPGQGVSNRAPLVGRIVPRIDFLKAAIYRGVCRFDSLPEF